MTMRSVAQTDGSMHEARLSFTSDPSDFQQGEQPVSSTKSARSAHFAGERVRHSTAK